MKYTLLLTGLLVLSPVVMAPAQAAGCVKGAVVGGVIGHMAGHHGVAGAAAGCAVGHHEANKQPAGDRDPASDNANGR